MAVSSISSDYTGRKKDISILQYPNPSLVPEYSAIFSFEKASTAKQTVAPSFGSTTRFCSGVQKLVQRYTIILLTNVSSQENFPAFGTSFLYTLQAGISSVDTLRASQIFRLANYEALSALTDYQNQHPEIPSDERIARADLTGIAMYGGSAAFDITIYTEAGDTLDFLVPLPKP
jgi:hypothetical protein